MAALTGTLAADFSPFYAAVQKAEGTLKSFEAGAGKVGTSLDRMVNQFSGKKVMQEAALMERALEQLAKEGIALTSAELQKMGATATEAAEKMKAMGVQVPPGIQKIADAANNANKETTSWKSQLGGLAGQLGIAFSVGAVVNFAKSVMDLGGEITDMSARLGISTDAVQGFKLAAEQSGSSLDAVGASLAKMNLKLSEGDKSTVKALGELGLKFSDIAAMAPEDAFLAITDALQKVENQGDQTRLGVALMGKGFTDIQPAVKAGFRAVSDGATKMSADTIAALDEAGDALGTFQTNIKVWAAESYNYARGFFDNFISETYRMIAGAYDAAAGLAALAAKIPGADTLGLDQAFIDSIKGQATWYRDAATAMDLQTAAAKKSADAHSKLPPVLRKTKDETDAAAKAASEYGKVLDKYSGADAAKQVSTLDRVLRDLTASGKLTAPALKMITQEAEQLSAGGATLTTRLQALVTVTNEQKRVADLLAAAHREQAARLKFEESAWTAWENTVSKALANVKANSTKLTLIGRDLSGLVPQIGAAAATGGNLAGGIPAVPGPGLITSLFGTPAQLGQQLSASVLAAIQGGGNPVAAAAGTMGSNIGSNIAGMLKKDGSKMFTGALGGIFSAALPVIGSLLGPLTEAIWNKLFGTAGRDKVKDFAASFGGFDALHLQLNTLGAEGEVLWKTLTQGVGKNNPAEAEKAITAITTALEQQKTKTAEATAAAEASAAAQVAANQKALDAITARYAGTLSKLESEFKSLNDMVAQEAEEAVMGVAETQARARMKEIEAEKAAQIAMRDAELEAQQSTFDAMLTEGQKIDNELRELFGKPFQMGPPVWPNGPSGSSYTPPGSTGGGTGRSSGGRSGGTAIIQLDGRTLAEVLVPAMPGVITRYGLGRG